MFERLQGIGVEMTYPRDNLIFRRYLEIDWIVAAGDRDVKKRLSGFERSRREVEITSDGNYFPSRRPGPRSGTPAGRNWLSRRSDPVQQPFTYHREVVWHESSQ